MTNNRKGFEKLMKGKVLTRGKSIIFQLYATNNFLKKLIIGRDHYIYNQYYFLEEK